MNKTKIEWCDFSWNPVTGCLHGCPYCYARRIAERFKGKAFPNGFTPTFYPERLQEPVKVKKPARIFVCDMADLFGEWTWGIPQGFATQEYVVNCILNTIRQCPQHTFLFLTKNPARYDQFEFPCNCLIGATITRPDHLGEMLRATDLYHAGHPSLISFEPLLGGLPPEHSTCFKGLKWIIIGAQTGPSAVKPKPEWVQSLIDDARKYSIPVFLKDNLGWPEVIREFPE